MPKLFMLLIGCTPAGRNTEQHDVFFGIANSMQELVPEIVAFWPEAKGKIHLDAWREVNHVNGYSVQVVEGRSSRNSVRLFFINLGGYRRNEFEEFHYKMLVAATGKGEAIKLSKETAFFKHTGFQGAPAHVDDKFGVDVDDVYEVQDILPASTKTKFSLQVQKGLPGDSEDEIHLGYFKLDLVDKWYPGRQGMTT